RIARSDLCAAECEAGDRQAAWRACNDALTDWKTRPTGGQVEFSNTAEAALAVYKFDEAERLLAESTKRASPESWGNPFQHLAGMTRRELAERLAEDAACARLVERARLTWRALVARLHAWQEARRAAVLLADEDMLVRTMRPYYVGGSDLPEWMVPEVVRLVG